MKEEKEERIPGTPVFPNVPDILWDLNGFPYNAKYPPAIMNNPLVNFHGYKTDEQETFFYDFAVQRYDVRFEYKGKMYYLGSFEDHVAVCDDHYNEEYEVYPHANALLENFKIDGRPLLELIDEIDDAEPV